MENQEEGLGQDWKLTVVIESLEGLPAMMEGGICRKWEPEVFSRKEVWKGLWAWGVGMYGNRTGKSGFWVRLGWGGAAGVGSAEGAGAESEGKSREKLQEDGTVGLI